MFKVIGRYRFDVNLCYGLCFVGFVVFLLLLSFVNWCIKCLKSDYLLLISGKGCIV